MGKHSFPPPPQSVFHPYSPCYYCSGDGRRSRGGGRTAAAGSKKTGGGGKVKTQLWMDLRLLAAQSFAHLYICLNVCLRAVWLPLDTVTLSGISLEGASQTADHGHGEITLQVSRPQQSFVANFASFTQPPPSPPLLGLDRYFLSPPPLSSYTQLFLLGFFLIRQGLSPSRWVSPGS